MNIKEGWEEGKEKGRQGEKEKSRYGDYARNW